MAEQFISLSPDSTGKKLRTRESTVDGNTVQEEYKIVIETGRFIPAARVTSSCFRTLGSGSVPQVLYSLQNATGSGRVLVVRRLVIDCDITATIVATTPMANPKVYLGVGTASGGTVLAKNPLDPAVEYLHGSVISRGATASDGGAATAITVTASPLISVWSQFLTRTPAPAASQISQYVSSYSPMIPNLAKDTPIAVREGQVLAVRVEGVAANNPTTAHYLVNIFFEEGYIY